MPRFSRREQREHYEQVAKGEKATKRGSKFSKKEQISYARGRMDENNQARADYKYKNSSDAERNAYREKRREYFKNRNK